jgi:P27 family predicted phage terminase small subunit
VGERGPLRKPEGVRQGHRQALLAVIPMSDAVVVPAPPTGIGAYAKARWEAFFRSDVARSVDPFADLEALHRWALDVDEERRIRRVVAKAPVVDGSQGQPRPNPLTQRLVQLATSIAEVEAHFGMNPASRARLGLTLGQASLTAAQLNLMVTNQPKDVPDDLDPDFRPA